MRDSTQYQIHDLYLHLKLSLIVGLILVTNFVSFAESCPLKCTCTLDKPVYDSYVVGFTFPLVQETTTDLPRERATPEDHGQNVSITCQRAGLQTVLQKEDLNGLDPKSVIRLDLSQNEIEKLKSFDFQDFTSLQFLKLSSNRMEQIEKDAFEGPRLKVLMLDRNHLSELKQVVFPTSLEDLSLEENRLPLVPRELATLHNLRVLNLAGNRISAIKEGDLRGMANLLVLTVDQNKIDEIEDRALAEIPALHTLDVNNNKLDEIPSSVLLCPQLVHLRLGFNHISWISEDALQKLTKMEDLMLMGNPLRNTHVDTFRNLPSLKKLILKENWEMSEFPNLNGSTSLEVIRIDRASLKSVPDDLCRKTPKLKSLVLHRNQIARIPKLEGCTHLRLLDLSNNKIEELDGLTFEPLSQLQDLLLQNNLIREIKVDSFSGLSNLQVLNLESNFIYRIHANSFLPLKSLEDINLGNNFFPELPSIGFEHVVSFKAHNNRHLKVFPDTSSFPSVHSLVLSYAYHCCPFLSQKKPTLHNGESTGIIEDVIFSVNGLKDLDPTFLNVSSLWPDLDSTKDFKTLWADLASGFPSDVTGTTAVPYMGTTTLSSSSSDSIECIPKPGPFMPCRDLFDWWTLRCGVWIVFLLALLGNGAVVVVLIFARAKMDVPRFLVTNLAMADFCMGIYLGFLAVVDASTLGEFRMYAIPWQMSTWCQAAGFFGVLSSELSVYTLTVITLERNYAITHAMHLNKRLSLRHAAYIMSAGWVFSALMAVLPIIGISDYRKFAVCLPFETDGGGFVYVIFIMFINGIAFLILMGCYLKIYCAIRGSQAWNSNDSRIAKRMALLVFTDFLCWAPIAFLSLTAASGMQLISLEEAKIFTIFILPLNSCCNPFLYALLTKQFKKDCVMLCKTIEESRVTRGIGRCRHSSNFSNRQTPANTNSALDPISKGDTHKCVCHIEPKESEKLISRFRMAAMKYFLCHKNLEDINSFNEYKHQSKGKGKRNASLSSETYSSSWSDSLRKGNISMSLKILEKKHPHSWILSRKPSQDSNISSSRNDSSATTASTSTWRISRSSVSSDISSGGSKGTNKGELYGSCRLGSGRERRSDIRPTHTRIPPQHSQVLVMQNDAATGAWVSSLVRGKPKLQKQVGFERDAHITKKNYIETVICPLHHRPESLSCVYEQESFEEEEIPQQHSSNGDFLPSINYSASKAVPRKLSNINSRSSTVMKEGKLKDCPHSSMEEENTPGSKKIESGETFGYTCRSSSLNMLSPIPAKCLAARCPSEGQICPQATQTKPTSPRGIDCIRPDPIDRSTVYPSQPSPICTETTALMTSDSEDDEVFVETEQKRLFETHFPIEGDPEVNPLMKEGRF